MRAPRDPAGRRRAIVQAAVEVVAQVGVGKASHRAIAQRAGVPLGATTYYFPTLADLVAAALEAVGRITQADLALWAEGVGADVADLPASLSSLAARFVADRSRALLSYELYLMAARDPALRDSSQVWVQGVRNLLTPLVGAVTAATVTELLDGVMLQAVVTGATIDQERLVVAIARLIRD